MSENSIAPPPIAPVIAAAAIAIAAWIINLFYGLNLDVKDRGLFGDMFGAVNAAFSGLAFIGVVYAIFLQRHEISIAKKEIEYTKIILSEQKDQLKLQNTESKKQSFENTYFQMLQLFIQMTNQIDLKSTTSTGQSITKGKDVFPIFVFRFNKIYRKNLADSFDKNDINIHYNKFYESHNTELGHYFRFLYNIVNYINNSENVDKYFYMKILRAQLSDAEIAIIFYNGISAYGERKFKPLIEKYGLLKNLNDRDISNIDWKQRYQESAFGNPLKLSQSEQG